MTENKARSEAIIQWLHKHQLISRKTLCDTIGYDAAALHKAFKGERDISRNYLDAFESELKKYGYECQIYASPPTTASKQST